MHRKSCGFLPCLVVCSTFAPATLSSLSAEQPTSVRIKAGDDSLGDDAMSCLMARIVHEMRSPTPREFKILRRRHCPQIIESFEERFLSVVVRHDQRWMILMVEIRPGEVAVKDLLADPESLEERGG